MSQPAPISLLSLRDQATVTRGWLQERLNTILPALMERSGLDMWLVIAREYNEDPVIMTLLPAPAMAARRRTILCFTRQPDGSVERITVSRYGQEGFYEAAWDPDKEEQYACLARLVAERDPKRIGINYSETTAFADGLSYQEHQLLATALDDKYVERLYSAESLCVNWLEQRLPAELASYPALIALGHKIIAEAFSLKVIHPGITTTDDVVWWMRERMQGLGLDAWFNPSIDIQAHGEPFQMMGAGSRKLIMPGDLLHCDMGFYYLELATDQQQHAYVLRPGETEAPAGLTHALHVGNRVQEIHFEELKPGRTGNEVLHAILTRTKAEGIDAQIYTHPLGYHGHAAGPIIGLWDQQDGVPGKGDLTFYNDTVYSIEFNVKVPVPEWDNQKVWMMLEEDAMLVDGQVVWLDGCQTELHLIG